MAGQASVHNLIIYRDGEVRLGEPAGIVTFIDSLIYAQRDLMEIIMKDAELASIEIIKREPSFPEKSTECAISLEEFVAGDKYDTCQQCKNSFKTVNFDKWLRLNLSCPVCRSTITVREQSNIPST